jgi:hypothetical protein
MLQIYANIYTKPALFVDLLHALLTKHGQKITNKNF